MVWVYNTICEDCGIVFKAKSKRAFLCPKCVKRRISESHKKKKQN
nr:MAG TPA: DNA-directed RNA polymerase II subunit [Caudoviricetes sp.]